jgi:hypothetical protein
MDRGSSVDRNRGSDKDHAANGTERRGGKAPQKPDRSAAARRKGKPAVLGIVVAASAVGAWLLRRERPREPEGTWRDALGSGGPGRSPAPGPSTDRTDER